MITDPLFYLLAVPAVILLGLGKGGFAGLGMISTPLLALRVPPLQAATIILPLLITQDAISVWTYRRDWSAWNLKVLMPGAIVGMGAGTLFASYVSNAAIELAVGGIGLSFVLYTWLGSVAAADLGRAAEKPRRPHRALRRRLGRAVRLHVASGPCRRVRPSRSTCCRSVSTSSRWSAPR